MPRLPREYRFETREARRKIEARSEPYWRQIVPGTFIGLRKGKKASAWIARQRQGDNYIEQRIGTPDDHADADGEVVLTYAQAVGLATTLQVEKREPRPKHYADGVTLNAVVDGYFEEHLAGKGSERNSTQQWNRHGRKSIGERLVTALDAPDLRRWHRGMAAKAPTVRGKVQDFDPADADQVRSRKATANRVLTIAKAALNYAWRGEGTVKLPADVSTWWAKVEPFELGDDPPPRMLEQDEIRRLLNAAPADLRDLLSGAFMTGGRRGELLTLQARDYDAEHGIVRLHQHKTGKTLLQPLTPEGEALFERLTAGKGPTDPIFTRADGNAWGPHDVTKPMAAAVEVAKLVDVSFKTTRATYGKLLLLATRDIEMVAKALGHSDSRITRRHYAAYLPSELGRAVAKMPKLGLLQDNKVSRIRGQKSGTRR